MATSNEEEYRYVARGKYKHSFGFQVPSDYSAARCGTTPKGYSWLGTGSQAEREKLARLPECSRCKVMKIADVTLDKTVRRRLFVKAG